MWSSSQYSAFKEDMRVFEDKQLGDHGLLRCALGRIIPKLPQLKYLHVTSIGWKNRHDFKNRSDKTPTKGGWQILGRQGMEDDERTGKFLNPMHGFRYSLRETDIFIPVEKHASWDILSSASLTASSDLMVTAGDISGGANLSLPVVIGALTRRTCSSLMCPGVTGLNVTIHFDKIWRIRESAETNDSTCLDGAALSGTIDRVELLNRFFHHYPNLTYLKFKEVRINAVPTVLPKNLQRLSSPSSSCDLFRLPSEIITEICHYAPQSIMNLRLTCRHLLSQTDYAFLQCHFRELTVCAHINSLVTLNTVINHDPRFANAIRTLNIDIGGRVWELGSTEEDRLYDRGIIRLALRKLLPKLPRLEKIAVVSKIWEDCFGSHELEGGTVLGLSAIPENFHVNQTDWGDEIPDEVPEYTENKILVSSYIGWDVLRSLDTSPNRKLEVVIGNTNSSSFLPLPLLVGGLTRTLCSQLRADGVTKLSIRLGIEECQYNDHVLAVRIDGACIAHDKTPSQTKALSHLFYHFPNLVDLYVESEYDDYPDTPPTTLRKLTWKILPWGPDLDPALLTGFLACVRSLRLLETLQLSAKINGPDDSTARFLCNLREAVPDALRHLKISVNHKLCLFRCGGACKGPSPRPFTDIWHETVHTSPKEFLQRFIENLHVYKAADTEQEASGVL